MSSYSNTLEKGYAILNGRGNSFLNVIFFGSINGIPKENNYGNPTVRKDMDIASGSMPKRYYKDTHKLVISNQKIK